MPTRIILTDGIALLLFALGFAMAFRQPLVRRLWAKAWGRKPPRREPRHADPARYALTIFGVMAMAFALTVAFFTTAYGLLTGAHGP